MDEFVDVNRAANTRPDETDTSGQDHDRAVALLLITRRRPSSLIVTQHPWLIINYASRSTHRRHAGGHPAVGRPRNRVQRGGGRVGPGEEAAGQDVEPLPAGGLGVDVKVIVTPPCIFSLVNLHANYTGRCDDYFNIHAYRSTRMAAGCWTSARSGALSARWATICRRRTWTRPWRVWTRAARTGWTSRNSQSGAAPLCALWRRWGGEGATLKHLVAGHDCRWKYKAQEYKRELRQKCRECYELIDADNNGTLDKKEVALMMGKMLKEFRCAASNSRCSYA